MLGRRADGYHLLDSLVVFAAAGDVVHATPDDGLTLEIRGPFAAMLRAATDPSDNLVMRAARALADAAGIVPRARLVLEKHLPLAAGIGGGSADAAATLRVLARLWGLAPADAALALRLGADVPVCLAGRPARMGGVGDALVPAPTLPTFGLVLANPGVAVATPAVFRARSGPYSPPLRLPAAWADAAALAADLRQMSNDLQAPALALTPPIGTVLAALWALPGALLARMSGSGATCFALFATAEEAQQAAAQLARPGWWVWGGGLAAAPAAI